MATKERVAQAIHFYGMAFFDYGLSYKDSDAEKKREIMKQHEERAISLLRQFEQELLTKEESRDN